MYRLKNWAIIYAIKNPFLAPELNFKILTGNVYDHPKFPDGAVIATSKIVSSNGLDVTTKSGTVYTLDGPAHKEFEELVADEGRSIDYDDPIKWKDK